jgi:chromosomal replication initiator protein
MAVADSSVRKHSQDFEAAQRLWSEVLDQLSLQVNRQGFDTWLAPTKVRALRAGTLEVEVPNSFFAEWIGQHYLNDIRAALRNAGGRDLAVSLQPRDLADAAALLRQTAPSRSAGSTDGGRLQARYTFDNFIVGESTRLACAAARSVAESPGRTYNPLFIYGGVGLGKTHLIQAIGNQALRVNRSIRVHYTAAEALFLELIQAIEKNTRLEFKRRYRGLNLLLLDDIHYLIGKERLQEEIFHIFNHLHDAGSQIVFTSDRPPKDLPTLESRLISRLGSGLVVDIQPPELETRIAILKQKAAHDDRDLPDEVAYYIAARVRSSVRELEGCLIRLVALASLSDRPVTVGLAEEALRDLVAIDAPVDRETIIDNTADEFGIPTADIKGSRRTKQLALARQVAMYLLRKKLDLSLKEIGFCFGGRDHTTVMHAIEKVERLKTEDAAFSTRLKKLDAGISRG